MNKIIAMALWAGIAGLAACQSHEQVKTAAVSQSAAPVNDTARAYQVYLNLKDELVKADGQAAQQAAKQLVAPSKINGCGDAAQMAGKMAATTDVKQQRAVFLTLSQDMIPLIKGFKNHEQPVYVQYCPMANKGMGGYWLSAQKEIKNPYYGKTMLDCGEVKEEIK